MGCTTMRRNVYEMERLRPSGGGDIQSLRRYDLTVSRIWRGSSSNESVVKFGRVKYSSKKRIWYAYLNVGLTVSCKKVMSDNETYIQQTETRFMEQLLIQTKKKWTGAKL